MLGIFFKSGKYTMLGNATYATVFEHSFSDWKQVYGGLISNQTASLCTEKCTAW